MSSLSLMLWMMDHAHINHIDFKNVSVQMCFRGSCGSLMSTVTIISPHWLYVANTMIFLMSFLVSVEIGVVSVVAVSKYSIYFKIALFSEISG